MCIRDRTESFRNLCQAFMYIFCHGIDGMVSTYPFGKFQFLVVQVLSLIHIFLKGRLIQDGIMSPHVLMIKGIPVDDGDAFH